jgi:acetolactate synthase-1/2/3 large subunit
MTASELASAIAGVLADAGSEILFGLPGGGHNLDLIGAAEDAGLRFVLGHMETTTAIMAATYADLTGRPTACVVTRGPGAASAINGAAQALLDRQPLLLITDTVSAADSTRISHQRLDQCQMFSAVTKWSTRVGGPEAHRTASLAVKVATEAPSGPVHLDFDPEWSGAVDPPAPVLAASVAQDLEDALARINASRRPVLVLGVGARTAMNEIRAVVERTHIPVLMTYRAKGVVADSSENSAGLFTGATIETDVIESADLVVMIGLDAVELIPSEWSYSVPVVGFSSWPETSPYLEPEVQVVGNLPGLVRQLGTAINDEWPPGFGRAKRLEALASLRSDPPIAPGLAPLDVVERINAVTPAGTIATVDAGAHMLVAMPAWEAEGPEQILISSGLATMGFALPAAIAAALAYPDRRVVCLVGDGGLGMALAELETVARLNLSITIVVFNDSLLSLIAVKQKAEGHGGQNAVRYRETDFAMIGAAYGIASFGASSLPELDAALTTALADRGPSLIDVVIDPSSYPHVIRAIRGVRVSR